MLVKHQETDKALLVSDDGDAVGAVWVPKAMLVIDPTDRGRFIVATMSQAFATQKRLRLRCINTERYTVEEAEQLANAEAVAARTRNSMRGYRTFNRCNGRDHYA